MYVSIGFVTDMLIERDNDSYEYPQVVTDRKQIERLL